MAKNYLDLQKKLEETEAQLRKTIERTKTLEAQKKQLAEEAEAERLRSRGALLEKHLREPALLTNEQIDSLLAILFGSADTQEKLDGLLDAKAHAGESETKTPG